MSKNRDTESAMVRHSQLQGTEETATVRQPAHLCGPPPPLFSGSGLLAAGWCGPVSAAAVHRKSPGLQAISSTVLCPARPSLSHTAARCTSLSLPPETVQWLLNAWTKHWCWLHSYMTAPPSPSTPSNILCNAQSRPVSPDSSSACLCRAAGAAPAAAQGSRVCDTHPGCLWHLRSFSWGHRIWRRGLHQQQRRWRWFSPHLGRFRSLQRHCQRPRT